MNAPTLKNSPASPYPAWLLWGLRAALVLVILAGGLLIRRRLVSTTPTHERKTPGERSVSVTTLTLSPTSRELVVRTTGTVVAARELALRPRVSGEIVSVHPSLEPGAILPAGTVAVVLDATDYELIAKQTKLAVQAARIDLARVGLSKTQATAGLVQATSSLVTAQYAHKLELGQQDVARHEWTLVENRSTATDLDRDLTLRRPHLEKALADIDFAKAAIAIAEDAIRIAEANVKTAETAVEDLLADLELAELNVQRCQIRVPFDAVVLSRDASPGGQVSSQTDLAMLADARVFWVEVSVPVDRLSWVSLPSDNALGAVATIRPSGSLSGSAPWSGTVIRRLPSLTANGRQARVLVAVSAPLADDRHPLLLDSFVNVEIGGPRLDGVFEVPTEAVHDGHDIWLCGPDGRLVVKTVAPLWSDGSVVVIDKGLTAGDILITSNLASPVPGMKVDSPATAAQSRRSAGSVSGRRPAKPSTTSRRE